MIPTPAKPGWSGTERKRCVCRDGSKKIALSLEGSLQVGCARRWKAPLHLLARCEQQEVVQNFQITSHVVSTASYEVGEEGFIILLTAQCLAYRRHSRNHCEINKSPFFNGKIKAYKIPVFPGHHLPKGQGGLIIGTQIQILPHSN